MLRKLLVGFSVTVFFMICVGASEQTVQNWDDYLKYYYSQSMEKRQEIWDAMTEEQKMSLFDAQEREWDTYYESHFKGLSPSAQDEILEQLNANQKDALERAIERASQPSLVFESVEDIDEFLDYYQDQEEERQKVLWDQLSDDQKVMVTQRSWDNYLVVFETFSKEQKEEIISQMSHEQLIALGEAMIRSAGTTQASHPEHSPLFGSMEEQKAYQEWYEGLTEKQREDAVFQDPKIKEFLDDYISSRTGSFGGGPIIPSTEAESTAIPLGPGEEIAPPPHVDY